KADFVLSTFLQVVVEEVIGHIELFRKVNDQSAITFAQFSFDKLGQPLFVCIVCSCKANSEADLVCRLLLDKKKVHRFLIEQQNFQSLHSHWFHFPPRQYETATYTQTSNLSLLLGQYTFPTSRNIYVHTGGTPSLVLHNRIRSCFLVIWAVCTSGISTY